MPDFIRFGSLAGNGDIFRSDGVDQRLLDFGRCRPEVRKVNEAARAIRARQAGEPIPPEVIFPTIDDGLAGVAFVEACVRSSKRNAAWVSL